MEKLDFSEITGMEKKSLNRLQKDLRVLTTKPPEGITFVKQLK